jgi:hypothetical protein
MPAIYHHQPEHLFLPFYFDVLFHWAWQPLITIDSPIVVEQNWDLFLNFRIHGYLIEVPPKWYSERWISSTCANLGQTITGKSSRPSLVTLFEGAQTPSSSGHQSSLTLLPACLPTGGTYWNSYSRFVPVLVNDNPSIFSSILPFIGSTPNH